MSASNPSCGKYFWAWAQGVSPASVLTPLHGRAGTINGSPAYWAGASYLLFEWARDQWVIIGLPTHADDLRVGRHLTTHVPAIRYPFQVAASWPGIGVQSVGFSYAHGRPDAHGITLAQAANLNLPVPGPYRNDVRVDVGPVGSVPASVRGLAQPRDRFPDGTEPVLRSDGTDGHGGTSLTLKWLRDL